MSQKSAKRVRESAAQEPDEPEKVTPKRPKTQVRAHEHLLQTKPVVIQYSIKEQFDFIPADKTNKNTVTVDMNSLLSTI